MRILFLCPYVPSQIRVRPFNFVRSLAERGHEVTLVALCPPADSTESVSQLRTWCRAVHVVPLRRRRTLLNGLRGLLSDLPLQASYSRCPEARRTLRSLVSRAAFDVAHVEHLRGVVLAEGLGSLPVVFDSVDSISLLLEKTVRHGPSLRSRLLAGVDLARTRRFESGLARRFAQTVVCSELDRAALIELGNDPARIHYVPNGVDTAFYQPLGDSPDPGLAVFTGKMSYHANAAAALDLVRHIMPRVWAQQPEVRLAIVGKDPPAAIVALGNDPRVRVTGYVSDMRPHLGRAGVAVCFVRYGVGLTNKTIQAMAMGTPVVASPHAVSTLGTVAGQDVLVGRDHAEIAAHIIALVRSPSLRERIGQAGRRYVVRQQSWEAATELLEALYERAREL